MPQPCCVTRSLNSVANMVSNPTIELGFPQAQCGVLNRSIEILEPGKFREDNGDKTKIHPLSNRGRVI